MRVLSPVWNGSAVQSRVKRVLSNLEVICDIWRLSQADPAIGDSNKLVHHALIGPLAQKWGDGIVSSIKNKQQGWDGSWSEVEQLWFGRHLIQYVLAKLFGHGRHALISNDGLLFEREQEGGEPFNMSVEAAGVSRCVPGRRHFSPKSVVPFHQRSALLSLANHKKPDVAVS